ncbi:hypothetical protein [uncultured Paraglaciecola sp.]|uniref:hypothetical protein n=1 Tax=uncultured Paraglaciecola sp. TaxID=1765024 RepID=UPI0025F6CCEE|nr:hypothetical protein [uncultured Paraglaciecola sp.]
MSDNQLENFESTEEVPEVKPSTFFQKSWLRLPTQMISWLRLPTKIIQSLRKKFSLLTLSQWMYLLAFLLLLVHAEQDVEEPSELLWVGALAGVGLVRELWHVFNRLWEHMLGKGLILVLYAATANFALAVSALKINVITGIEPGPFVFTLGFATLIMLPFWLLMSSIIFFSAALIAGNLWLVLGILLRLIRVKVKVHWEDKVFVFITMILRLVLIPYVIISIFFIATPYAKQIELFERPIALINQANSDIESEEAKKLNDDIQTNDTDTDTKMITFSVFNRPYNIPVDEDGQIKWLDKLIAGFIFHFETYPKSACKKAPEQRSLPIDENLLLLVSADDSDLGYQFSVGPCVGNFSDVEPHVEVDSSPE